MFDFLTITWDGSRGLDLGFFTLRYYSLLFALGFVLGYFLMKNIFKKEGVPQEKLDTLLTYVVVATIVGARLGHVFFYQWDYYSKNLIEIFKVWEGGLASHGAAIAIIIAIIIYCRRELKKSVLWMLDRVVLTVALAACLIRLGNWMNSEIYGDMANSNFETVFASPTRERILNNWDNTFESIDFQEIDKEEITDSLDLPFYEMRLTKFPNVSQENAEGQLLSRVKPFVNRFEKENKNLIFPEPTRVEWDIDNKDVMIVEMLGVPRHPTQLYEAFAYLMLFFILYRLYLMINIRSKNGFIFGMFLILLFGFRFFIEFLKENQVSAEQGDVLNIGQKLSIPLVAIGLFFVFYSFIKKKI